MTLPGWNSAESAGFWSTFHFWASIVSLFFLGATEVLSHRYSDRHDELIKAEREAVDRHHAEEAANLRAQIDQTRKQVADDHSLKNRIRALFNSVDPQIVRKIDAGETDLTIRMPEETVKELDEFTKEAGEHPLLREDITGREWGESDTINNGSLGPQGSGFRQVEVRIKVFPELRKSP